MPSRTPLTRERVLVAAIELADSDGVEGLSMRRLAKHLGYEVMSLYNHIANKDDLLEAMVDVVAGEITEPQMGSEWRAAVRHLAISAHEALLRHPWAASQWSIRWPGPNRFRHMESLLRHLADGGFDDETGDLGFHAVTLHITGFTQQQLTYSSLEMEFDEMTERFAQEVDPAEFPLMIQHVQYHVEREGSDDSDEFGFVLDLILEGLERRRDQP